jgi:hypothetical protein
VWGVPVKHRRIRASVALVAALFASAGAAAQEPLARGDFQAVLGEIREMLRTRESDVVRFEVRQVTPERIERFYATPEVANLPRNLRENGLIFGGLGGKLLSFDRPSDVLAKMQQWFPSELHAAPSRPDAGFGEYDIHVWGPFENWQAEPSAFVMLWKCYPGSAWLRPRQNPFARLPGDRRPMLPPGETLFRRQLTEFGPCVREHAAIGDPRTDEDLRRQRAVAQSIAQRATPVLSQRFAQLLQRERCRRTGPDDCVLVLNAWASLVAQDPALARALQALEADAAPDAPLPLPAGSVATLTAEGGAEDTLEGFNTGLRQGGFLQAKLRSVLAAPQAWPGDALARTFAQITALRQRMTLAYQVRWEGWELENTPLASPWLALCDAQAVAVPRQAIARELSRLHSPPALPPCARDVVEAEGGVSWPR